MPVTVAENLKNRVIDPPDSGVKVGPDSGLVNCAITFQGPLTVESVLSLGMRFPSADLVEIAAAQFPAAVRTSAVVTKGAAFFGGLKGDWNTDCEGPIALISVAPGMVKLSRFDPARRERALSAVATGGYSPRGVVSEWSVKSQGRMMQTIRQLDLNSYIAGRVPVMVTLTLPGDWVAVAPDAAAAVKIFQRFVQKWRRMWGAPAWVWKREFQTRGAPHWHLWLVPPLVEGVHPEAFQDSYFRAWLSQTWAECVAASRDSDRGLEHSGGVGCVCSEFCRSVVAGTGVDRAAGMTARDPQRLAVYFLKESRGGTGKEYQNSVPWLWCVGGLAPGQLGPFPEKKIPRASVGRFWGSVGLGKAVSTVEIDELLAVKLWRAMSAIRSASLRINAVRDEVNTRTGEVVAVAGSQPITRVVHTYPVAVVGPGAPEQERLSYDRGSAGFEDVLERDTVGVRSYRRRRRPVARVVKSAQQAGWVGANDGPSLALQLARYAALVVGDVSTSRDVLPPVLSYLSPVPSIARAVYVERKRVELLDLVELARLAG